MLRRHHGGWAFIDALLTSAVVATFLGGLVWMSVKQQRAAKVDEVVGTVMSMAMHGELAAAMFSADDQPYTAGALSNLAAMPSEWRENATQFRNPLSNGDFKGYQSAADGYVFWWSDVPRWACVDLVTRIASLGFVSVNGIDLNRSSTEVGKRVVISTTTLAQRCNINAAGDVATIILTGPAPPL